MACGYSSNRLRWPWMKRCAERRHRGACAHIDKDRNLGGGGSGLTHASVVRKQAVAYLQREDGAGRTNRASNAISNNVLLVKIDRTVLGC